MKRFSIKAAAALLLLAGAAQAQPARPGPPAQPGARTTESEATAIKVSRDYLIGSWTDDNDCTKAVALAGDGTFTTYDGRQGQWSLQGDQLTMSGRDTIVMRVVPVDWNTITLVNADGSLGHSTRCRADVRSI